MKILAAIDSFKGSLTSIQAGTAVSEGIRRVLPDAEVTVRPLADGGEGTVDAVIYGTDSTYSEVMVCDPLGREISAKYGLLPDGTAVIEMAEASGLTLLSPDERDPMRTTSFGTGQLIRDAVERGCRSFIIGIGGSASNDGGIGCLQALGFDMLDSRGEPVPRGASGLAQLAEISSANAIPELSECRFIVACDVKNPLCGPNGCSAVFAPQKGADEKMIVEMDIAMLKYADLTRKFVNANADPDSQGSGAAGGMGFALMNYLGAEFHSGADLLIEKTHLEDAIKCADLVVTGEGRLDAQTAMGKAPSCIARLAKKHGKPVIAFCGAVGQGAEKCLNIGIDAYFPIVRGVCTAEEAMDSENAARNLTETAMQVFRAMKIGAEI